MSEVYREEFEGIHAVMIRWFRKMRANSGDVGDKYPVKDVISVQFGILESGVICNSKLRPSSIMELPNTGKTGLELIKH
jgi:hypothetical protein